MAFSSGRQQGEAAYAIAHEGWFALGVAGLWENWKDPARGEWVRTFTIITVPANELVSAIHDRMPAILEKHDYERWLSAEPVA